MTNPTPIQEQLAAQNDPVITTAKKLVRVRSFTKSVFEKVGVPVAIGAVTGLVVTRAARRSQEDAVESGTDPVE